MEKGKKEISFVFKVKSVVKKFKKLRSQAVSEENEYTNNPKENGNYH